MKRTVLGALVLLAVGIGLIDPYACVQHSISGPLVRDVPAGERARALSVVRRALALLPAPRGYVLDKESVESDSERQAAWEPEGTWAAPVAARAERSFEPVPADRPNAPPVFEQRIFLNSEVKLPTGLGSETGTYRAFPVPGAAAVIVSMAGLDGEGSSDGGAPSAGDGGRVALPATPQQRATAVTILRVLIADARTERAYREAVRRGTVQASPQRPPARAGAAQSLVVELYGGRRDVEALGRRLPAAALRKLLDR